MAGQHDVIVAALNAVGGLRGDCPICGNDAWTAHEPIHLLPIEAQSQNDPTKFDLGGPPLIVVSCQKCGHIRFFDATTLLSHV